MGAIVLSLDIRPGVPDSLVMAPAQVGGIGPAANEGKELLLVVDMAHRGRQRQRVLLGLKAGNGLARERRVEN